MSTIDQNLADLAEVLRALADCGAWPRDGFGMHGLPDPRDVPQHVLVAELATLQGETVPLVDAEEVTGNSEQYEIGPQDAEILAALLVSEGADGHTGNPYSYACLTVGDTVPGPVWVTVHACHGDPPALAGEGAAGNALARIVRADFYGPAQSVTDFIEDVRRDVETLIEEELESLDEEVEDAHDTVRSLVDEAAGPLAALAHARPLALFDRNVETGSGRTIDEGEFTITTDGLVEYRDWDKVVHKAAQEIAENVTAAWINERRRAAETARKQNGPRS